MPAPARQARGFTLIEASLATIIIGVGFLASMQLFAALTLQTRASDHHTTALFLANNIYELTSELAFIDPRFGSATFGPEAGESLRGDLPGTKPFDDLDDFHNLSLTPPINASRQPIPELAQYTQNITVTSVDPNRLTLAAVNSNARRVTVTITYRPTLTADEVQLYQTSWVRMR